MITRFALAASSLLLAVEPAHADPVAGKKKAEVCATCHGPDGNSTNPKYPVLAGQTFRYIYLQLRDFKEGRRKDPECSPMALNLAREDMIDIAEHYAAQKKRPIAFKADGAKVAVGRKKADEVLCPMCHLGGFSGQNEVPRVAGQHYEYVVKQLRDFKSRTRTNDAGNMTAVTHTLSDVDIEHLAHYIANLD